MRLVIGLILAAVMCGCQSKQSQEQVVARVGNYEITADEFNEAYKNSAYGREDNKYMRSVFLRNMINQKLIILDAQRRGLDRDPQFLKMVENFWQQSLLTYALQEKNQDGGNLDAWVDSLKANTKIQVNEEYFK